VINNDQVTINRNAVLGEGAFGTVVAGEFCCTPVAVKCCKAEARPGSTHMMASILNELNMLCRIRHPNIVVFCGACFDSPDGGSTYNEFRLVLEKVHGVTLKSYILEKRAWIPNVPHGNHQVQIMKGVCQALVYMHSRRPCIVHGDLKPSNVMVESRRKGPFAKLLDFGLSRRATHTSTMSGFSMNYVAPEVFDPMCMPRPPIDIFSTGRLLFFVSSARDPKPGMAASETDLSLTDSTATSNPLLPWLPTTSLLEAQRPLIEACCSHVPAERPNATEVYKQLGTWRPPADSVLADAGSPRVGPSSGASSATFPIIEEEGECKEDFDLQERSQGERRGGSSIQPSSGDRIPIKPSDDDGHSSVVSPDPIVPETAEEAEKRRAYLQRLAEARMRGIGS